MKGQEILIAYMMLIVLIFMSSLTIWAINAGEFIKDHVQAKDHNSSSTTVKTISVLILVLSIFGIFGVTLYVTKGNVVKETLKAKYQQS